MQARKQGTGRSTCDDACMQRNKKQRKAKNGLRPFSGDCPLGQEVCMVDPRQCESEDTYAALSACLRVCVKRDSILSFFPLLHSSLLPSFPFFITSLLPLSLHQLHQLHHRLTAQMASLQQPPSTTGAASSALDSDSVLILLQSLLPVQATTQGQQDADSTSSATRTSEPTVVLSSPYEGLASLSHAIMTAVGFRLVGLGEDDSLENDRLTIDGKPCWNTTSRTVF